MSVSGRDAARSVVAAAMLSLLVFATLVEYAPDSTPYSPNNYGWNGTEQIVSAYHVTFADSLSSLPGGRAVLVELQPTDAYTGSDAREVATFVSGGGTLLVAGSSGFANGLLAALGTGIAIESGVVVNDAVYNWRAQGFPLALVIPGRAASFQFLQGVKELALNEPSPLDLAATDGKSLAVTSPLGFEVPRSAGAAAQPSVSGQFVVAAAERMGNGTVVVVGDPSLLTNSGIVGADDARLLGNLFNNSTVVVDASHWKAGPFAGSTAELRGTIGGLYGVASGTPARYVVAALSVAVGAALVPEAWGRGGETPKAEPSSTTFNSAAPRRMEK